MGSHPHSGIAVCGNEATQRRRRLQLLAVVVGAAFAAASCAPQPPSSLRMIMDWFPQIEQAGFWQAQIEQHAPLPLIVMPGGPKVQNIPQVAAGVAQFGVAPADDVLIARSHGVPIKAVAAVLDHAPYTLVYHPDPNIRSISDLKGHRFAINLGISFWEWAKATQGLQGATEFPLTGDLTLFRNDPSIVQQGVYTTLPYRMAEAKIPVAQFRMVDLGYRPYNVLFTTDDMLEKHRPLVLGAVAAVNQGWRDFLADSRPVKAVILKANGQMTPTILAASLKTVSSELLPADREQIGCMTGARWRELAQQLEASNQLTSGFDERQAYDLTTVSGCR